MLFKYFRSRKLRKAMIASCQSMIGLQYVLTGAEPVSEIEDVWVLGYLYGATTAFLDRMGVEPSNEAYELLEVGYGAIFENSSLGLQILSKSMDLRGNLEFEEAQLIGGTEIGQFTSEKPAPFALGAYISESKSPEIRRKLRDRWLK